MGERQSPHGMLVYPHSELESAPELEAELNIVTEKGPESRLVVAVRALDLTAKTVLEDTETCFKDILHRLKHTVDDQ